MERESNKLKRNIERKKAMDVGGIERWEGGGYGKKGLEKRGEHRDEVENGWLGPVANVEGILRVE